MSLLIYSGLLYLIGVSVVLALKPALMFSADGNWKEFGIGRARERYTWMPFWLFAIIWAIISYTIVLVIVGNQQENTTTNTNLFNRRSPPTSLKEGMNYEVMDGEDMEPAAKPFRKGYYIMNVNTKNGGTPQYIYLGPRAPNLHYDED
jgi:hypothetical protein